MKVAFLVTTYNLPNLQISLRALRRYCTENRIHRYYLILNNDNPDCYLSKGYISDIINLDCFDDVLIRNTEKNQGCLGARLSILYLAGKVDPDWFMFIDDDDVILDPAFDPVAPSVTTISHRALVTHRLLEVLHLIQRGDRAVDLSNPYQEFEEWKLGCVGFPYKYEPYMQFIKVFEGFLPELYHMYGSERVMEPDDVILMNCWNVWLQHTFGPEWESMNFQRNDRFSYSLTYLENRKGRYYTEPGVVDLRYGENWDGKTTYESIIFPIYNAFDRYMSERH